MFKATINNYILELEALRDFVKLREKYTRDIKKTIAKDPIAFLPRAIFQLEREVETEQDESERKKNEELLKKFKSFSERHFKYEVDKDGKIVRFSALKEETIVKSMETQELFEMKLLGDHYVLKSTLINLISVFETLLKAVVLKVDAVQPIDDDLDEKKITFTDLKEIGDLEEARKLILEEYMESNFLKSQMARIKFVQRVLKVDLPLAGFEKDFIEINERRNIFIHNDGKVGNKYLNIVDTELIKKYHAKKNDYLLLTTEYVVQAINIVELIGLDILYRVWKRFEPESMGRPEYISYFVTYDSLIKKKYFISEYSADFIINDSSAEQLVKDIAQINKWLAIKNQGRYEEIKDHVSSADYSAKSRLLRLGRLAILDDKESFFPLLIEAFDSNDVTMEEYQELPVFEKMRRTKESKELIIHKKSSDQKAEDNTELL